jgi:glycosyltransferase involved in cell wall biosynthesis
MLHLLKAPENRDGQIDLEVATKLLADSGIFDAEYYLSHKGRINGLTPIEHYLLHGWHEGFEPSAHFNGRWLYPYFASAGLNDPPALTYATLCEAGLPTYPTQDAAERVAQIIRSSGLFDAEDYAACVGAIGELDPVLHYVIIGERLGYAPSKQFDPLYYSKRYPDVGLLPVCLLEHYLTIGKTTACRPVSLASELEFDTSQIDPNRETILLVSHQASRTGAPILVYNIAKRLSSRYNIVTLVLLTGELFADFEQYSTAVIGPLTSEAAWGLYDGISDVEAEYIVSRLNAAYRIKFAIVNSIDSRTMLKQMCYAMIPSVTLVHEFAVDVRTRSQPPGEMGRWLAWTNEIVFSSTIVADSLRKEYPHFADRQVHILPQGQCELPPRTDVRQQSPEKAIWEAIRPPGAENALVVLGCGTVFARKGVDLFVACAARVTAMAPDRKFRFVWIGHEIDSNFSRQLQNQITSAGLSDVVTILEALPDLEPAYSCADIFFLSSRLDALPNVAIDSALRGIPIVCFDQAGGIAELLSSDTATRAGVVPYLDIDMAAKVIKQLAGHEAMRAELGRATQRLAKATFNMDRYVERLIELGLEAERVMQQRRDDFKTIQNDAAFDMIMFLAPGTIETTPDEAIRLYLARSGAVSTSAHPTANYHFRRPCPGFHPQIYIRENASQFKTKAVSPLAHFIRSGRPDGPWRHGVITPADLDESAATGKKLHTAIHAHFFYPELVGDFVSKLAINSTKCDLLLSTNNERKAALLREATKHYDRGDVVIRIFPNRGRDIGAFFTGFADQLSKYDVVGHFHGKRSLHVDKRLGESWREFLWQSLLGGFYPMMDTVIGHFAKASRIGLVFAEDPNLLAWDENRQIAEDLALRMGRTKPLPPFFDFPIGSMFWARTRALEPLLRLDLKWEDYPKEPVPIDGTVLHAIERLLPFAAIEAGFSYATTYVPGMTR